MEVWEDFGVVIDYFVLLIRSIYIDFFGVEEFVKLDVGLLICFDGRYLFS